MEAHVDIISNKFQPDFIQWKSGISTTHDRGQRCLNYLNSKANNNRKYNVWSTNRWSRFWGGLISGVVLILGWS